MVKLSATEQTSPKRAGRPKGSNKGFSSGGSYVTPATVDLACSILHLQQEQAQISTDQAQSFLKSLLVLADEEVQERLFPYLLRACMQRVFPEEVEVIEQIHQAALRIAQIRQKRSTLRPYEDVRNKLLIDDVPQLHEAILQLQTYTNNEEEFLKNLRGKVYLRLANVLYYLVQMLAHELHAAIEQLVKQKGSREQFDEQCQRAIANFQLMINNYCAEAGVSPHTGLRKTLLKFSLRSVSGQKLVAIESALMLEDEGRQEHL